MTYVITGNNYPGSIEIIGSTVNTTEPPKIKINNQGLTASISITLTIEVSNPNEFIPVIDWKSIVDDLHGGDTL